MSFITLFGVILILGSFTTQSIANPVPQFGFGP
ncbi:hypothetical protein GWI33_011787, partial [Rhynchophorus ferrugineus]